MDKANLTEEWLRNTLASNNIPKLKDVLLLSLDTTGQLYIQPKSGPPFIIETGIGRGEDT